MVTDKQLLKYMTPYLTSSQKSMQKGKHVEGSHPSTCFHEVWSISSNSKDEAGRLFVKFADVVSAMCHKDIITIMSNLSVWRIG